VPAADFSAEELLYLPRHPRAHRLYGMSPVEQIALTVNIAPRRDAATLDYYRTGSTPDAFATLPKEWTADQLRSFQDYFDALMSGNLARRRQTKFMPADFKLIEARQPPLKDQYDEWLARLICYAFSVPVSAFVSQVNRATSETLRQQATQEGLVPLKAWVKNALDHVIQQCMNEPSLEFVWVGDDAVDPLQQAQTLNILVSAGIKTREEARADLGLGAAGSGAPGKPQAGLGKYNSNHDERGLFSTADNAVATVGSPARKPRPTRVQVASNDRVRSDAGRVDVAQAEGEEDEEPRPDESGENGIIEYFNPDTGRVVPYPATAIPPQGWVDMRTLPDPSKPAYFEPLGGVSTSEGAEATPAGTPGGVTPPENPSGDPNSTDQDDIVEFGSTRGPRFANGDLLESKFNKHGSDFGALTASEYENQASSFLSDLDNADVLQFTRKGGDIVRFNPLTDEFGVLGSDGTIHTYYRPNPQIHGKPTNLDYFYSQKERVR
jgi:hypothetical protein